MSKKFVLIDPSISGMAGHYYEYALHVLSAARRAGYETHLATNRRFDPAALGNDAADPPWRIHAIYSFGFWSPVRSSQWLVRLRTQWRKSRFRLRCAFRYSVLGIAWSVRDHFTEYLSQQPVSLSSARSLAVLIPLVLALKLVRFLVLL